MGFTTIAERTKELLDDRTRLIQFQRELMRLRQMDQDFWIAKLSDDDLQPYVREVLMSVGSPPARPAVVEQYCRTLRESARERLNWCRHLRMLEDLTQTTDPATAFSILPNRKCVCEKFGYETETVTPDADALIAGLKQLYCGSCKDRSPKQA